MSAPLLIRPEVIFAGYWRKMLARYGGGVTEAEYDRISQARREAKIGKDTSARCYGWER